MDEPGLDFRSPTERSTLQETLEDFIKAEPLGEEPRTRP